MTVARTDWESLPPLAQRLCRHGDLRGLIWRFAWVSMVAALAPLLIAGVGALIFLDELKEAHQGGTDVWGLPVVAIGEEPRGWISIGKRPVGVVAIGTGAMGVVAVGTMAIGVVAIGTIGIGIVSVGSLAVGLLSWGAVAIGFVSGGAFSLGWFAFGACVAGWYAYGAYAVGAYAWGAAAWGLFRAETPAVKAPRRPVQKEALLFPNWRPPKPSARRPP